MRFVLLPLLVALAACAVGPDYRRPDLAVPAGWSGAEPGAEADPSAELAAWWARFDDPLLTSLVERALRSNLELRVAEARVAEARALRRVVAADLWPQLAVTADGSAAGGEEDSLFLSALDLLWEIDVFGRIRRASEAARADAEAALEDRRSVLLALVGEVAGSYVELRGLQSRSASVRANLEAQEETRGLTEAQRQVGLASDLDVERARALVAATASELPALEISKKAAAHRLGVLLGEAPGALAGELAAEGPIPAPPPELLVGVPAEVLRRRPDLRRAERELAAATARIGEASAELYPRFALIGTVGFRAEDAQAMVDGTGSFWTLGPSVEWPIFAAGRLRANVRVQDARQQQALARYERALLGALEEVENALVRYAEEQARRRELARAVAANREAVELARRLHANGLAPFLDVLDAERSLLISESRLLESETAVSLGLVQIFVALGGGWEEAEEVSRR